MNQLLSDQSIYCFLLQLFVLENFTIQSAFKASEVLCTNLDDIILYFHICSEYAQLFAALIARTAKDVDVLIDSLPSEESTAALQVRTHRSIFQTFEL